VTSDSVQFVDVGVTLAVTPSVSPGGDVTMRIEPAVSAVDREVTTTDALGNIRSRVPIVRTQQTQTTVVVRDGETIVLGGLMEERQIEEINRLPILGQVPLVGRLFQNRHRHNRKSELVILLTPHVAEAAAGWREQEEGNDNASIR
jgi:type II secretory pathway component GspD/PulD (secretin)